MADVQPVTTLSNAIIRPLIDAYSKGGIALVILIIGMLLMGFAFVLAINGRDPIITYGFLVIGIACILSVVGITYILVLVPINETIKKARENEEALNSVQGAALTISEINKEVTNYVCINTNFLHKYFNQIRALVGKFPGSGLVIESKTFTSSEDFVRTLVTYANTSRDVGSGLHEAIKRSDAAEIKRYVERIMELKRKSDEFFAKHDRPHEEELTQH